MSDDEHIVVSRVFNESIEISPPYFIMDQEISPNTQPLFIFIQRKTYDSTEMLNLTNIYRKHARPTDILIMFANVLGGPFTYLDSKMKDNVPCLYGSVYNSDIDSTNDAPTLQSMGYNAQVYDYEPSNTPCDQLPNGHLNCPIHTMNGTGPACVIDIATGSS